MFCKNCGAQLPDEASFCWKCGKPQKQGVEEPKWEICEVRRSLDKRVGWSLMSGETYNWSFWAEAVGPNGIYNAGGSQAFVRGLGKPDDRPAELRKILDSLIDKLVKDGWEPLLREEDWYSFSFRRLAK